MYVQDNTWLKDNILLLDGFFKSSCNYEQQKRQSILYRPSKLSIFFVYNFCTEKVPLEQLEMFHHSQLKETTGYDVYLRSVTSVCALPEKRPYKDTMRGEFVAEPSNGGGRLCLGCSRLGSTGSTQADSKDVSFNQRGMCQKVPAQREA